jgi:hypothetical protein
MEKITLYELENDNIRISMKLYFNEKGQLIFDGYDIGKKVKDLLGDSDYEYTYTIEPEEVEKIFKYYGIAPVERMQLLIKLKDEFGKNEAYTLFGKFMEENQIKYDSFNWV